MRLPARSLLLLAAGLAITVTGMPAVSATAPASDAPAGVTYRLSLKGAVDPSTALSASLPVDYTTADGTTGTVDLGSLVTNWRAAGLAKQQQATIRTGGSTRAAVLSQPRVRNGKVTFRIALGKQSRAAVKSDPTTTVTVQSTATYPACPTNTTTGYVGTCQGTFIQTAARNNGSQTMKLCMQDASAKVSVSTANPVAMSVQTIPACGAVASFTGPMPTASSKSVFVATLS